MNVLQRSLEVPGMVIVSLLMAASLVFGQKPAEFESVQIPEGATALEGIPTVRIDTTSEGAARRVLDEEEAAKNRLAVRITDGEYFWASRENRRLQLFSTGPFTYLAAEPGRYIRVTKLSDRFSYVEHVDSAAGSVTYWGELRFVFGRR